MTPVQSLPAAAVSPPCKYVVAVSQAEAHELADLIGHESRREAEIHLGEVKAPPTDPYYAAMYRVYKCQGAGPRAAAGKE